MKNLKTIKKALISSVLSLILCFSMLLGTTFAWFTDTVSSGNTVITAGNLDVELYHADKGTNGADEKVDDSTLLFDDVDSKKWEPGAMAWEKLTVENKGNLNLKYQLTLKALDATVVNGISFASMLKVAVVDETFVYTRENVEAIPAEKWSDLATFTLTGNLEGTPEGATENPSKTYGVIIWWQPSDIDDTFNIAEEVSVKVGVTLVATQQIGENDSTGDNYDEDAWHPDMKVYNAQDLQAALNNGVTNIQLMSDIELDGKSIIIPPAVMGYAMRSTPIATVIDLNGKSIIANNNREAGAVIVNNGYLIIRGDENSVIANTAMNGASAIENNGIMLIEGGSYVGAPSDLSPNYAAYAINTIGAGTELTIRNANVSGRGAVAATKGSKAIIESGTYHTPEAAWAHAVYANGEGTEVIINGGTFSEGYAASATNWGMYQICSIEKAKVTVNGGNFEEWDCANGYDLHTASDGVIEIFAGTFADNPASQNGKDFTVDGYKSVANNGKYYVVSDSIDEIITCAADLLALGGKSLEGTYMVLADIDLGGAAMPTIGAAYGKELTIIGNGHTISNATTAHTTHNGMKHHGFFYAYTESTLNISDLTFDNVVIDARNDAERNYGAAIVVAFADGKSTVNLNNVDVNNSKVLNNTPDIGDEAGVYVGYQTGTLNMTDCDSVGCEVIGETAVKTGAFIGMVNGTTYVNNCTTDMTIGLCNRIDGTLYVDGIIVVTNTQSLNAAISAGKTNLILADGSYEINNATSLANKVLVFNGSKNAVITMNPDIDQGPMFSELTFNGVTINFGKVNYKGIKHAAKVVYNDCQINGLQFLFAKDVEFNNCDLDSNGAEHCVWTYGSVNVSFTECDFTYGDRAVNCYSDNDITGGLQTVAFENCTFTTANENSLGAVEINSSNFSVGAKVSLKACTAPAHGELAYISEYDTSAGAKTTLTIDGEEAYVVMVGNKWAADSANEAAMKAALSADKKNIIVVLAKDMSIDIGTGWKMGGASTVSITIKGNGKTLTLSSTYRSYFNMANPEGTLYLENMTLTNAHTGTHFFDYTTHFNCDAVATNVVFAKSPLVSGATVTFNDCQFVQSGADIYGLWVMSGSDVTVNGGVVNTDRGIKIADENSATEKTFLSVSGTDFNTNKKAAILVTTAYGAEIKLDNVDISDCAADSTNAVWIDEDRTDYAGSVTVTGGTVINEP